MPPLPFPHVPADGVPWLAVGQMREVDRLMIGEYAIPLELMMENAGRSLAEAARMLLGGDLGGRVITVLAGSGGNGGGGLVAARHLANAGAAVGVATVGVDALAPVPRAQYERALHAGAAPAPTGAAGEAELVIDALLGYSQRGAPAGAAADLIEAAGQTQVLALDTPSGLELATGTLHEPHVVAEATLTLALPKRALRHANVTGTLLLADISVPAALYQQLGLDHRSPFGAGPIVEICYG